jgi:PKD repeat protein
MDFQTFLLENNPVSFTDTSTGSPTSWSWSFGDGSANSTEQHPTHTYANAWTYNVSLTAANAAGSNTTVKAGYVVVTGPVYSYGISCIQNYTYIGNISGVFDECDSVAQTLDTAGWTRNFYHKNGDVTKEDFGTDTVTHPSLVDSTVFYYSGHGLENTRYSISSLHNDSITAV